jgi:hypothetical protein
MGDRFSKRDNNTEFFIGLQMEKRKQPLFLFNGWGGVVVWYIQDT